MRFLSITKPGIIFGNLITLCGGFFLASQYHINLLLLLVTMIGMALVVASGCVFNNVIDRDIDLLMERTKDRAIANGLVSEKIAILYATLLGILGLLVLWWFTNPLTVFISVIGLFFYVVVYSLWFKRRSVYGTLLGGISGAVPPVIGYTAVANRLDLGALIVFLILFLWQVPHFYAIAIYRLEDYRAANIPVLPVLRGIEYTKKTMLVYILAFALVAIMPTIVSLTSWFYFVVAAVLSLWWLYLSIKGFKVQDNHSWAKKMFGLSILIITVISFMLLAH